MNINRSQDKKFDHPARERMIIDYISSHEGCNPEAAFQALNKYMSRQTFFKRLSSLKEYNMIRVEDRNKRDKCLHVNSTDIIIILAKEFDEFEKNYFNLLERAFDEIEKPHSGSKHAELVTNLLLHTLSIFLDMVHTYAYKLSIKWPFSIPNKELLQRVQVSTLNHISKLFFKLYDTLEKHKFDDIMYTYFINVYGPIAVKNKRPLEDLFYSYFKGHLALVNKKRWAAEYKQYKMDNLVLSVLNSFSL